MTVGLLEILLVEAHGLPQTDFLNKIDPYVVLNYKGQVRKTTIARGQGANPRWNEQLRYMVEYPGSGSDYKLTFKVMDHDTFSSDDFLGQTTIHVGDLLSLGVENGTYEMQEAKYRLDAANGNYCGDIKIRIKFTAKTIQQVEGDQEEFGGWKASSYEQ